MKRFLIGLSSIILTSSQIQGQELSKEETRDLLNIVYYYFFASPIAQRNANRNTGKSERFLLLLKVNSEHKIGEVSLLADNSNLDSGFAILNKLNTSDFQSWKSRLVKNKTLIMPMVVINSSNDYKESMEFIQNFHKLGQTTDMINLSGIEFKWPIRRREY